MFYLSVKCNIDNETSKGKKFWSFIMKIISSLKYFEYETCGINKGAPESTKEHRSNPKALGLQS